MQAAAAMAVQRTTQAISRSKIQIRIIATATRMQFKLPGLSLPLSQVVTVSVFHQNPSKYFNFRSLFS